MTDPQGSIDFFISYRGPQAAWARWINWVIRSEGYSTTLMDEFQVGTTWTSNMRDAARDCRRLIPLYSIDYWASGACVEEFDAYWRQHLQDGNTRFLLPLIIEQCTVPRMHAMLLAAQLHDLGRDLAKDKILKTLVGIVPVAPGVAYSEPEPPFPIGNPMGGASPVVPAVSFSPFPVSAIPVDRKGFLNCTEAFETFEQMLTASATTRILLVHGYGNQGKSTLLSKLYNHTRNLLGAKSTARVEFKKAGRSPEEHVADIVRALGVVGPIAGNIDERVHALLDACVARPVVLFFDAFEHAERQHRDWVSRILDRCLDDEHLRCVIAGRELPPAGNQPWIDLCVTSECDALKDTDSFITYAKELGYKGKPADIAVLINVFVRLRERNLKEGREDPGISSESALTEIKSLCAEGRKLA